MTSQIQPVQLSTVGQWHTLQLILDVADFLPVLPPGLSESEQDAFLQGEKAFYQFFHDLLADVFANQAEYGVPKASFVEYYETPETADQALQDRIREQRLKVRKVIDLGVLEFIYQVGQLGEVDAGTLKLTRPPYDQLLAAIQKKAKTTAFIRRFETLGLAVTPGNEVLLRNDRYPGMIQCLSTFAKACARIKEDGLFYFRRCDFGVFAGKALPAFEDALHMAPETLRAGVQKTDDLLRELKYKREIIIAAGGGAGYRIRYTRKGDKVVYWCRVRNWFSPPVHHNLRWPFEGSITPRLFARLEEQAPGLSDQIFVRIKKCTHCYGEVCVARANLEYAGELHEVCKEGGWEYIGIDPVDYANLWLVLRQVDGLLDE